MSFRNHLGRWPSTLPTHLLALILGLILLGGVLLRLEGATDSPASSGEKRLSEDRAVLRVSGLPRDEAVALLRWRRGNLDELPSETFAKTTPWSIDSDAVLGATLLLTGRNLISIPVEIPPAPQSRPTEILFRLLPSGTVTGTALPPEGWPAASSPSASMSVAACPTESAGKSTVIGTYPVRLLDDHRWQAELPAGCFDLQLRIGSYVPIRWQRLSIGEGQHLETGTTRLVLGATVNAHILSSRSGESLEQATVHLVPATLLLKVAEHLLRGEAFETSWVSRSDPTGWVRLEGVLEGEYYMVAQHENEPGAFGLSSQPISLLAGSEITTEVSVEPLANLEASLDLDLEESLRSSLERLDFVATPWIGWKWLPSGARYAQVGAEGIAAFSALPPGRWLVEAHWVDIAGQAYTIAEAKLDVLPGAQEQTKLQMQGHLFVGEVLRGDEPLSARLLFKPQDPNYEGSLPRALSDEEGRFFVLASQLGDYTVTIEAEELTATVPNVELVDPQERLTLRAPAGRIEGVVTDSEGAPVHGARVAAEAVLGSGEEQTPAHPVFVTSDVNGRFSFESLNPGRWSLDAFRGAQRSRTAVLELNQEESVAGIHLELGTDQMLRGRLTAPSGESIALANGHAFLVLPTLDQPISSRGFSTDREGRFEIPSGGDLPVAVTLEISSQGLPTYSIFRRPVEGLELEIPTTGGRAELYHPAGAWSGSDFRHLGLVSPGDGFVPLQGDIVAEPGAGERAKLILPFLAAGHWKAVSVQAGNLDLLARFGGRAVPAIAEFNVPPGGSVVVQLSASAWESSRSPEAEKDP